MKRTNQGFDEWVGGDRLRSKALKTSSDAFRWDIICVTARVPAHAEAYKLELQRRSMIALAPSTLILALGDPGDVDGVPNPTRIGSGGATLNAILLVAEHLSALAGHNNVDMEILRGKRVLVLHVGGADQRMPAFSLLPMTEQALAESGVSLSAANETAHGCKALSTVDLLLQALTRLSQRCPPGVFVVSSEDAFVQIGEDFCERFALAALAGAKGTCGSVTAIARPVAPEDARCHGVYSLSDVGTVRRILYRATPQELETCGSPFGGHDSRNLVAKVCGVVFFNAEAACRLLEIAFDPSFEACSYHGVDNGLAPHGFSLYLDLLACLGSEVSLTELLASKNHAKADKSMIEQLWRMCGNGQIDLQVVVAHPDDPAQYTSVRSTKEYMEFVSALSNNLQARQRERESSIGMQTFIEPYNRYAGTCSTESGIDSSACIVNSVMKSCRVAPKTIIESSMMEGCSVGAGAVCSGLKRVSGIEVPPGLILQQVSLLAKAKDSDSRNAGLDNGNTPSPKLMQAAYEELFLGGGEGGFVIATYKLEDESMRDDAAGTFLGLPWAEFLRITGIDASDLWPSDAPTNERTLRHAQLYPVVHEARPSTIGMMWAEYASIAPLATVEAGAVWRQRWVQPWRKAQRVSLGEAMARANLQIEFEWQEAVAAESNVLRARYLLMHETNAPLRHIIDDEVRRGRWGLLDVFDEVAAAATTPPDVAARTLAQVAELLAAYAGTEGGLRSGSARNLKWRGPLSRLASSDAKDRQAAVLAMSKLRSQWLNEGPVALIRAARHYEAAAQVLICQAVGTAGEFVHVGKMPPEAVKPPGQWVIVEAPARADLAGGWTDTPPLCWEHGGAVLNIALTVDDRKPIGAKATRTPELKLAFETRSDKGDNAEHEPGSLVVCNQLSDLEDYNKPSAPGALLKAAVLCCGLVSIEPGSPSLETQLHSKGGGLKLVSWSVLPQGSGLGTSSILAGVVMKAMVTAYGLDMDDDSLIHAVLKLEQMLTTGGGWQDQVGGLFGGAKLAQSAPQIPLHVITKRLPLSEPLVSELNSRLVLIFTGRPRLAKHLLQNVIRQWYGRMPEICNTVAGLVTNAESAEEAFRSQDLARIGSCMSTYWAQKRVMAPGCEPEEVRELREKLASGLYGFTLAGAGGGGFAVLLTREPRMQDWVQSVVSGIPGLQNATFHSCGIDFEGMTVS